MEGVRICRHGHKRKWERGRQTEHIAGQEKAGENQTGRAMGARETNRTQRAMGARLVVGPRSQFAHV